MRERDRSDLALEWDIDLGGKDSLGVTEAGYGSAITPLLGFKIPENNLPSIMPNHYGLSEVHFVDIERQCTLCCPVEELTLDLEGMPSCCTSRCRRASPTVLHLPKPR